MHTPESPRAPLHVRWVDLPASMSLVIDGEWLMINRDWWATATVATRRAHLAALRGDNPAVRVRGWAPIGADVAAALAPLHAADLEALPEMGRPPGDRWEL